MKRAATARLTPVLGWLLAGMLGLLLAAGCSDPPAAGSPPLPLVEVREGLLQAGAEPPRRVSLPHKDYRARRVFAAHRFEARFDLPAALQGERLVLQLDSWPDGGRILLNGHEVADEPTSTADRVVRYLRPFAFSLPPGLLKPEGNRLQIDWGSRETLVLVPRVLIAERTRLLPLYERKLFWEHTVVQGSMVFAAVVAVVMLGVWGQQRRREAPVEYLLIGLSALGWIIFNAVLLWSPVAASWFLWRRVIGFAGIGLFVLAMWVCLARLAGWRSRLFDGLCAAWFVLGPLAMVAGFLLTGATHLPGTEMLWSLGAAGLGLVPLLVLLRAVWRGPGPRLVLLLAFVLVSVGIAVREALIYVFQDPIGTVHLGLQLMAPLWLATACGLLVQDFVRTLRQAAAERAAVDRRLAEREAELAVLHARERAHATDEERHRIMQDMHDGLGSQLVSSLALAERGQLSPPQTAELLRACIDDLRLAIDTLGEGQVDLALAAGNLRFRMTPRLRAAGLRVRWDMAALPEALAVPGSVALPVLRVLQEALANATRHAHASQLQVHLALQGGELLLTVQDDGKGFDLADHAPGKGLAGMHKRARGLGARLAIDSSERGTCVSLRLPVAAPPAPGADGVAALPAGTPVPPAATPRP